MDEFSATSGSPIYETPMRDNDWFEGLIEKYGSIDIGTKFLMNTLLPAVEQVRVATERAEGHRNGVLIGLAAHQYRLATGSFPKSIDELTSKVDRVSSTRRRFGKAVELSIGRRQAIDLQRCEPTLMMMVEWKQLIQMAEKCCSAVCIFFQAMLIKSTVTGSYGQRLMSEERSRSSLRSIRPTCGYSPRDDFHGNGMVAGGMRSSEIVPPEDQRLLREKSLAVCCITSIAKLR